MGLRSYVKRLLIQKQNKRYEKLLAQKQVTYEQWITGRERQRSADGGKQPAGFCCFVSQGGEPAKDLLERIGQYFAEHPEVLLLYGDEDIIEDGERRSPWFKPDWSPDLLDSFFYFGSVVAMRKEFLERLEVECGKSCRCQGKDPFCVEERKGDPMIYFVTDQDLFQEWIRSCLRKTDAFQRGACSVGHIPEILFHARAGEWEKAYFTEQQSSAERENVAERESLTEKTLTEKTLPVVSVIIPSRDHPEILEKCLLACLRDLEGGFLPSEFIVVDNGSSEENRSRIRRMLQEMDSVSGRKEREQSGPLSVRYCIQPMEFNFSVMCNLGAEQAKGRFLLFLNDDVELCEPGTIARMAAQAARPYTGAVGIKLYYPDSRRIQHAGITNLPMGPVHKLQFLSDEEIYYFGANRGRRNVTAVTGACLMVEKGKFKEAGGFAEELAVAFNDVDLCFTLCEKGWRNVCLNNLWAYHHESLSRGEDESSEKRGRLLAELDKLYQRHPAMEGADPCYSVHLNREGLDTRIRPAYETAGNSLQRIDTKLREKDLSGYRQDACVLLRVESGRKGILQGYGVVLGDNNACYEKELLLCDGAGKVYTIPVSGQYRPDLAENMPDQIHVALCGFWIGLAQDRNVLPPGKYRVGMTVRNRVTGLKLVNYSNCYFMAETGPKAIVP